jgi:hypothetical protein
VNEGIIYRKPKRGTYTVHLPNGTLIGSVVMESGPGRYQYTLTRWWRAKLPDGTDIGSYRGRWDAARELKKRAAQEPLDWQRKMLESPERIVILKPRRPR